MVLDQKSLQEYRVNVGVSQGSVLGPTIFQQYISDLPDDVVCNIAIYADSAVLCVIGHLICGNNQNWLLNLNLIYDTLDWGRKWLVGFNAGKTQQVSFDWSNETGTIDVKMDRSVLDVKSTFKMLKFTFCSKLDWGSCIISIAKTASIAALIRSIKWFGPEVTLCLYKATMWPCMEYGSVLGCDPGCYLESLDKLQKRILGLLLFHLLPLLNPWFIIEM